MLISDDDDEHPTKHVMNIMLSRPLIIIKMVKNVRDQ